MRLLGTGVIAAVAVIAVSAQSRDYKVPRTPDGQPDLQGFWSNATYTPLERPANVTKEFYTPEEAAALRAQGFDFYDWAPGEIRLVTSWDQSGEPVERLAAAIAAL